MLLKIFTPVIAEENLFPGKYFSVGQVEIIQRDFTHSCSSNGDICYGADNEICHPFRSEII